MAIIGEIILFAGNFAPKGWKICNGESVTMIEHSTLYSILGSKYGFGDNMDSFSLPNIAPLDDSDGKGFSTYIICVEGEYPHRPD